MQRLNPRTLLYPLFAAILCVGAVSSPAQAQSNDPLAGPAKQSTSPLKLEMEVRKIAMQLDEIQKKTIESSADLKARSNKLTQHIIKLMKSKGFSPEADRKQLIALKERIMSGKLKKEERTAEIKKFQKIRAHLEQGRNVAMKDKELQAESRQLGKDTMAAMKKQDPRTEALLKRFAQAQTELRRIYQAEHQPKKQ